MQELICCVICRKHWLHCCNFEMVHQDALENEFDAICKLRDSNMAVLSKNAKKF